MRQKNWTTEGKITKENHHSKASNKKGVGQTAKCGTWVDEAHQPVAKICTSPRQSAPSRPEIRTNSLCTGENPHHSTSRKPKVCTSPQPGGMKFTLKMLNKMSADWRFSLRVGGVSTCLVGAGSPFLIVIQQITMNLVIWRILLF